MFNQSREQLTTGLWHIFVEENKGEDFTIQKTDIAEQTRFLEKGYQLNGNRKAPLPRGRGQFLNALSVQGVGRGTSLGRGHGHKIALGRGGVGHLPLGNGN